MSTDTREDIGEFYPGGEVIPLKPDQPGGGGGGSVDVDSTLTATSSNPVKSSGIWRAIWGSGGSGGYDSVVSFLKGEFREFQDLRYFIEILQYVDTWTFDLKLGGNSFDTVNLTLLSSEDNPSASVRKREIWHGLTKDSRYYTTLELLRGTLATTATLTVAITGVTPAPSVMSSVGISFTTLNLSENGNPLSATGSLSTKNTNVLVVNDSLALTGEIEKELKTKLNKTDVDEALSDASPNPVKSSGIWNAIWGSLTTTYTNVVDWATSFFVKKNGDTMTGDLTMYGSDDGELTSVPTVTIKPGNSSGSLESCIRVSDGAGVCSVTIYPDKICITDLVQAGYTYLFPSANGTLALESQIPVVDEDPTHASLNAVSSGGVYESLKLKANAADLATEFSTTSVYAVGAYCTYEGRLYKCTTAVTSTGAWTGEANWIAVTVMENVPDTTALMPKYPFAYVAVASGAVTLSPYAVNQLTSDGTAFTVTMGGVTGRVRDCVFVVTAGETAPTITWGTEFHPRTDAATDFACVAGSVNVYWVSEYAEGQFAVAGWQVTAGGSEVAE